MKNALILAGAALAFAATPAAAKPPHAKHGKHQQHSGYGYAQPGCPPGLAKKNNGCLPPGQAKKLAIGQRYAQSYGYDPYAYNQIPYDVRRQYELDPYNNYYYDQGTLYGVDPRTQIVEQIIRALIR
ncbi:hypothetical protein GCM10022280_23940 [Sphingomonas swuensis]|uniref:Integral membrane protein n=1 Tax=Sphingomonas swuensis TaxID=977800 RepID=A0ABP7T862_9SPHN